MGLTFGVALLDNFEMVQKSLMGGSDFETR